MLQRYDVDFSYKLDIAHKDKGALCYADEALAEIAALRTQLTVTQAESDEWRYKMNDALRSFDRADAEAAALRAQLAEAEQRVAELEQVEWWARRAYVELAALEASGNGGRIELLDSAPAGVFADRVRGDTTVAA